VLDIRIRDSFVEMKKISDGDYGELSMKIEMQRLVKPKTILAKYYFGLLD
jgi:hypothetical protein